MVIPSIVTDDPSYAKSIDTTSLSCDTSLVSGSGKSKLVDHQARQPWEIHGSVLECIGQTPIIKLQRMGPPAVNVYVKCESNNPGGSIKDRLALGIIEWAENTGRLSPGQTVVEASSGNTGIGLAMVCAQKGYPFICVMSENYSIERRKIMRFYGAKVILTPKQHKGTGMLIKAQELADTHGWFYCKQFENEANAWIHETTTGPEITKAFQNEGQKLDHFFMSYGSGGTFLGVTRYLGKTSPETCLHLCEPSNAPMMKSGIPTKYPRRGVPSTSFDKAHPVWSPHVIQGWAADFIPKLISKARDDIDEIHHVRGKAAIETTLELARKEGISSGISGGGILSAALEFAETCPPGTNILAVIPDTGERYMSTDLFQDIPSEMTPEEIELSQSTKGEAPPPAPALSGILPTNTDDLFDM
mmetsp:Transcript_17356/g.32402  ORF Transcript_17356/g.32402 Transcript_17356/m.32402 type:complete len:416 (-) Transcript_17356:135-1382(-)